MRIARLEASAAGDVGGLDEWPLLADVEVQPRSGPHSWPKVPGGEVYWHVDPYDKTGELQVSIPGPPDDGAAGPQYTVMLKNSEFGTLLGCMPEEVVPEVIAAFLHAADPELLGAVVGRLIAHVAAASSRRSGSGG